jgi:hypothetical protein
MKNKTLFQRVFILVAALIALSMFQITGTGCGDNPNAYVKNTQTTPVAGGGNLEAYVERQRDGEKSGENRSIRYYLNNKYTGTKGVLQIRADWTASVQYKRKTSESYEAGLDIGKDSVGGSVGMGSSSEYVTLKTSWYSSNTNGIKSVYYGPSNYVMWPASQVKSHSIMNKATLRISGHSTSFQITASA